MKNSLLEWQEKPVVGLQMEFKVDNLQFHYIELTDDDFLSSFQNQF